MLGTSRGSLLAHLTLGSVVISKLCVFTFLGGGLFIYLFLFIYGCVGSSLLCEGPLQLRQAGATLHHGARASLYRGLSCCGAQAPDAQAH